MKLTTTISRLLQAMRRLALEHHPANQDRSVSYRFQWDEVPSRGGYRRRDGLIPLELRIQARDRRHRG
jgi:hypothetical protein